VRDAKDDNSHDRRPENGDNSADDAVSEVLPAAAGDFPGAMERHPDFVITNLLGI
jgi:hypothetical protein